MKVTEVTLKVNGREKIFSEEKLTAILENFFNSTAERPTEGKWFKVDPKSIDQNLFKEKREDSNQEERRQLILEAFAEAEKNPKKYWRPFKTMFPEKNWDSKTVAELKKLASQLGDHNKDWVEEALEWAQRIHNGESWENVFNEPDTAKWYRVIVWKNACARIVGGSSENEIFNTASYVDHEDCYSYEKLYSTVPSVVSYD